ncbi:LOW QUALITY PROTEIN: hypothetical protein TorRG33x02_043140 [Trema orientale]|uniref:Uncharacterized protein n=1 Tax=Trema orientale TaxID=63057 RepID=A0A2P5FQ47_TREOI|nr:LOW QUALITY PROTEIN: hypothetical protein TorRG33x02_043140 [Trema orientale]
MAIGHLQKVLTTLGKWSGAKATRSYLNFSISPKELAGLEVDLYGSGEDSDQVQEAAKKLELAVFEFIPGVITLILFFMSNLSQLLSNFLSFFN